MRAAWTIAALVAACAGDPPREPTIAEPMPPAPIDARAAEDAFVRGQLTVVTTDQCGLIVPRLCFARSSAEVRGDGAAVIDQLAEMMRCMDRSGEQRRWRIIGQAEPSEPHAVRLAHARAEVMRAALIRRGVVGAYLTLDAGFEDRCVDVFFGG